MVTDSQVCAPESSTSSPPPNTAKTKATDKLKGKYPHTDGVRWEVGGGGLGGAGGGGGGVRGGGKGGGVRGGEGGGVGGGGGGGGGEGGGVGGGGGGD